MTTMISDSEVTVNVLDELQRECESVENRAIFDSPYLSEFSEDEYKEEHSEATFREIAIARARHDSERILAEQRAKEKCNQCFFKQDCLSNAYDMEEHHIDIMTLSDDAPLPVVFYGVAGGYSQSERKDMFLAAREVGLESLN